MPPAPIRVALLWHMHQPYYLDPVTGESVLPWVRLHALKDYWGMVRLVETTPGMRCTFNLVPSLVEQVEAYAAERTWDRQLVLGLREPAALDSGEAAWFVREGFHAHPPAMIEPYARYAELWRLAMDGGTFDLPALRDLQVWQKLAWVDPDIAAADPRVRALHAKGQAFDEHDKAALRAVELGVLRRIVPTYREAAAAGCVELSCSPYFHPILPLLCDSAAHHDAHPGAPLPDPPFRWPEDADAQLARAVEAHTRWFGTRPVGVWPSEGSVSDAAAAAIAKAGFRWMATDEDILRRSRARAGLPSAEHLKFRTHEVSTAAGPVRAAFRDHGLSDAIGFTYQRWPATAAVDDFVAKVRAIGAHCRAVDGGPATVFVILDGENAWEHYEGGGRPFLRTLYQRLVHEPDLEPVTMGTATDVAGGEVAPLPRLFAGSWIHGDFGIWIGHADDRRAWSQLQDVRTRVAARRHELDESAHASVMDATMAAEGSDWFWWYGDDHSSAHDRDFDALFRRHVRRAWHVLGEPVPDELHRTNITTAVAGDDVLRLDHVPAAGARIGSFFDRLGATPLERTAGAMHRVDAGVVLRCDLGAAPDGLAVWCLTARAASLTLEVGSGPDARTWALRTGRTDIAWRDLGAAPGGEVRVRVVVRDEAQRVLATVPADGLGRRVDVPGDLGPWTA